MPAGILLLLATVSDSYPEKSFSDTPYQAGSLGRAGLWDGCDVGFGLNVLTTS